jgi:hypothetical protein
VIDRERGAEGLGDQVADFFLEAAEDTRLGLADGNLAHAQGGRYLGRSLIKKKEESTASGLAAEGQQSCG